MTRLRILSLSLAAAACLSSCGDAEPPARATVAPASAPSVATVAPARDDPAKAEPAWQAVVPAITPAQVPATLVRAQQSLSAGLVERGNSPGPGALELYLAVLRIDPVNPEANKGLDETLTTLQSTVPSLVQAGRLDEAAHIGAAVATAQPSHAGRAATEAAIAKGRAAQALVDAANAAAAKGHVATPAGDNAVDLSAKALHWVPGFVPALEGRQRWQSERLTGAWRAAGNEDYVGAEALLAEARRLRPGATETLVMTLRIVELRQALTDALLDQGNAAVDKLDLARASQSLAHVTRIAAQPAGVAALKQRLHLARHYGPFVPAQVFTEAVAAGGKGPAMVVVPFGRFTMGTPTDQPERDAAEGPEHPVSFARGFAIARDEITVADFRRFVVASGYRSVATRNGRSAVYDIKGGVMTVHEGVDWRRDHLGRPATPELPVMHIAFEDAQAYASWLSRQTGQVYRLPSEAEFEYVLRAGKPGIYPWGDAAPDRVVGNLTGAADQSGSGRRWANAIAGYRDGFWGVAPVGRFPAEGFGTRDMIGNVSEWTLDCWHENYQRAPGDGSSWINPGCTQRVVRGASWASSLDQARSGFRLATDSTTTGARLGFRVVREL
jgi:formylglycine-generating enzyme required for sulfatase activity